MANTITSKSIFNEYTFEVVDKIPENFFVWLIGEIEGHEEYLPICEWLHPGDKDNYEINPLTLKAIKLTKEEIKALMNASHWGVDNLAAAEKALKSKRQGRAADRKRNLAQKTIEIYRKIS